MQYQPNQIAAITEGIFLNESLHDVKIQHILLDSRQVTFPDRSLFVALEGRHFDGHHFLEKAYCSGVRNFLISKKISPAEFPKANFILVKNTLCAFQKIAAYHRQQFNIQNC